jgi:hypothetical protein
MLVLYLKKTKLVLENLFKDVFISLFLSLDKIDNINILLR